jgi:hypothetical protein
MSNTSATGGYLQPAPQGTYPGGLSFRDFLQTVFVGISGLPGPLVRPEWQLNPPKQPDVTVDWLAIAVVDDTADANAFVGSDSAGNNTTQRHEDLEVRCQFYGPNSFDIGTALRDGFQVPQNLEALRAAVMGFVSATRLTHVPDLVNERWVDRYIMSVFLRREILRVYPILNFASASGTIRTVVNQSPKNIAFNAEPQES